MNACRVATRPTSKMKNAIAIGSVMTPSADDAEDDHEAAAHEQDQEVAGQDVGEESDAEAR